MVVVYIANLLNFGKSIMFTLDFNKGQCHGKTTPWNKRGIKLVIDDNNHNVSLYCKAVPKSYGFITRLYP